MSKKCLLCDNDTIFYIWTSSRNFPKAAIYEKLNIKSKRAKEVFRRHGHPVCFDCYDKLCEDKYG